MKLENKGEIVLFNPNENVRLEVYLENETVWLTQAQIAHLFGVKQPAISKHLINIFKDKELDEEAVYSILEYTASDGKIYKTKFYNLDAILSIGYRVNSKNATLFRKWSNKILKEYLLKGYSQNQRITDLETRLTEHEWLLKEHQEKIDFFVKTSLPPVQGIFFEGQFFDAYSFTNDLIRSAQYRIILIDNYIDDTVLMMLAKRKNAVSAKIYSSHISKQLLVDLEKYNKQYKPIEIIQYSKSHDRFLMIDEVVYLIGASLKDLGKKMFAFCKLDIKVDDFIALL